MLFNSFQFLFLFLPATLLGALLLERWSRKAFIVWLIGASVVFYGAWNPRFLWILCLSLVLNYAIALLMERSAGNARRIWLVIGLVWNLGLLGYFKYTNFLGTTIEELTGHDPGWPEVILPIGISFFTFQKIAFIIDSYRGQTASLRSFGRFALFVLFFPQLIAGPIVHHSEFIPQLDRRRGDRTSDISIGLVVLVLGLIKKLYIADTLALPANVVFNAAAAHGHPGMADAWTGALAYSAQIYFDFSAYSDMAIGLGRMFGFDLPINFTSPYKAASIVDFWRRWHITLSRFLRDYLYIPLGGNRRGENRRRFNLLATMVLGGLWHGAGWSFVLWGFLHGIYLLIAHAFSALPAGRRMGKSAWWPLAARVLTFLAVVIAWVPFRAADMGTTFRMWQGMFGWAGAGGMELLRTAHLVPVAGAFAIAFLAPNIYEIFAWERLGLPSPGYPATKAKPLLWKWRWTPVYGVATGIVFAAAVLKLNDVSPFIYFRF